MSKQKKAKAEQGYMEKASSCADCEHRTCDMVLPAWMQTENDAIAAGGQVGGAYGRMVPWPDSNKVEKNQRCGIGGFAVKKSGLCGKYELKVEKAA